MAKFAVGMCRMWGVKRPNVGQRLVFGVMEYYGQADSRLGVHMHEEVRHMIADAEFSTPEHCFINELSNSDADPEVSIARARVPAGVSTRWHCLNGIAERYVLLSGCGRVEVGNLPAQNVGPGDVVLIPPGCRQRITNLGAEDLLFLAICTPRFRPEAYEDVDAEPRQGVK